MPTTLTRWTARSIPVEPSALAASPGGIVWLAVSESTLQLSTDHGTHFSPVTVPFESLFDPEYLDGVDEPRIRYVWAKGRDVYVTSMYQLFVGRELGQRWERLAAPRMEMGQGPGFPSPIEAVWGNAKAVYFLENRGVLHQSYDDGKSWSVDEHAAALYQGAFLGLTGNGAGCRILRDGNGRLLATFNDGESWGQVDPIREGYEFGAVAVGPTRSLLMSAGTQESTRLFRSRDRGRGWMPLSSAPVALALAAGAEGDWTLLSEDGVFCSADDADSWQKQSVLPREGDATAAEAVSRNLWSWRSLWRSPEEGYALGRVRLEEPRSATLLVHGSRRDE